jgi:energy-converting hydrogenase Eha subunit F
MEQQFKMRQIEDALNHPSSKKEDIITIFLALQRQCFVLGNSMSNLVKQWPTPTPQVQIITDADPYKRGISSETKD